jgi:thiamine pyrophosphokinase
MMINKLKRVVIFANGILRTDYLKELQDNDFIIGVDRAAYWLLINSIISNVAIGDFDSTSSEEFLIIKKRIKNIIPFSPEKDFTDLELALNHAITLPPREVILYGAIGFRMDHTLVNIQLLYKCLKSGIPARIIDDRNEIQIVDKKLELTRDDKYRYLSILPLNNFIEITLNGFVYDISHKKISLGETIGISNEFNNSKATIIVSQGAAVVIRSRD